MFPLDFDRTGALVLAMVNPADVVTIDDVRLITGLEVVTVTTTHTALNDALAVIYSQRGRLECAPPDDDTQGNAEVQEMAEYGRSSLWLRKSLGLPYARVPTTSI